MRAPAKTHSKKPPRKPAAEKRSFGLQHHRHTGKLLHHKHTSYGALAVLLALAGMLLVYVQLGLQQIAHADSYAVYATVPAPVPTTPAVILKPAHNAVVSSPQVTTSGSCPVVTPAVVVGLYSGGSLLGSTPCGTDGSFAVPVTLVPGPNTLVARTTTITGDNGPDSDPITVTYTPANPAQSTSGSTPHTPGSTPPALAPLVIHSDKPYIVFGPTKPAEWVGSVSGGQPPYTIKIQWGDGVTDTYKEVSDNLQHISHTYTSMVPHTVKIEANDTVGAHVSTTLGTITPFISPSLGTIFTPSGSGINPRMLGGIYGAYLGTLSIVGILWLRAHGFAYATAHFWMLKNGRQFKRRRIR